MKYFTSKYVIYNYSKLFLMENFGERLANAMKIKNVSAYKLSSIINLQQSTISNYKRGKSTPSRIVSDKIASVLQINKDWLYDGEGRFEVENEAFMLPVVEAQELHSNKNGNVYYERNGRLYISVKLVEVKAFGSYLSDYQDPEFFENLEQREFPVDHQGKGNYICFQVEGNSMNGGLIDDSKEGAELLCRELGRQHWKDGFRGSTLGWVIVHKETVIFKDIKEVDMNTGDMVLSSRSGLPQHPDFTINMNDVRQIWKVIKRTQD